MKNPGKKFEEDFIGSVPDKVFHYRLNDGTASYQRVESANANIRFQQRNICDFILFDDVKLYLLELKSHKGKSVPFSCVVSPSEQRAHIEKGKKRRIDKLYDSRYFPGIMAGVIFNFRDLEQTYFVDIIHVWPHINNANRKSFGIDWIRANGVLIGEQKKRTRSSYDVEDMLQRLGALK
jgi:recombination protein U